MADLDDSSRSLLIVIVDTSVTNDMFIDSVGEFTMTQYLDAVTSFVNCYLMLKPTNKIAVIQMDPTRCEFIYPDVNYNLRSFKNPYSDAQCEIFSSVEYILRTNVYKFMEKSLSKDIDCTEPLMGASCAKALCYISRAEREKEVGSKLQSRILMITGGSDSDCDRYLRFMNIIFTAQKMNVTIDVCSLQHDVALLQQACDLTDGFYFRVPKKIGLLEYLLWIYLPDPPMRKKLVVPPMTQVDYRPFCFCHRQLIDIGFVCSVCLSIFCKYTPICTTCQAIMLKAPTQPAPRVKKKRTAPSK